MRRFWVFGRYTNYGTGGMYDFLGTFESLPEALNVAQSAPVDFLWPPQWWHVFDTHEGRVVAESDKLPRGALGRFMQE